jgi:transcriptional regulator with XRE-family HTH domain
MSKITAMHLTYNKSAKKMPMIGATRLPNRRDLFDRGRHLSLLLASARAVALPMIIFSDCVVVPLLIGRAMTPFPRRDQGAAMLVDVRQIKAARALLRWRQDRLAQQAGLAVATIRRLERLQGRIEANFDTVEKIRQAFETAGIAFLGFPNLGVHLRVGSKELAVADANNVIPPENRERRSNDHGANSVSPAPDGTLLPSNRLPCSTRCKPS